MPLVSTASILTAAADVGSAVAAFNVVNLESAEALARAAHAAQRPLILQISQNAVRYHGGLEPVTAAVLALAEASPAQLSVHLDHAEDLTLARRALELGYSSVMYDGSALPYDENVRRTREFVAAAHDAGVLVEAELGEIGGKDGAHAPGVRTDPDEAAAFVAATGVDALAVAVGSSHAMLERTSRIDLDLIAALHARVDVPLVLHGSSGVSDADLAAAIRAGMRKINVSTHLNGHFTGAVRDALAADPRLRDPRVYLGPGRDAMAEEAERLLRVISPVPFPA